MFSLPVLRYIHTSALVIGEMGHISYPPGIKYMLKAFFFSLTDDNKTMWRNVLRPGRSVLIILLFSVVLFDISQLEMVKCSNLL